MGAHDHDARQANARDGLRRQGIDVLAVSPGDDFLYLAGYTPHRDERSCVLFLSGNGSAFLVPELNASEAAPHVRVPTFAYGDAEGPDAAARAAAAALGGAPRVVAVADDMRADELLLLQQVWPEAAYRRGSEVLAPIRMIKSAEEVAALRRAARHADAGVVEVFRAMREGVSERDLAEVASRAMREAGAEAIGRPIVGAGEHSAFPHHSSSDRTVRAGEPVLADIGGRQDGYMSDITRMAFLGEPTPRYREIHAVVEEAVQAAMAAVRPGAPIREVDRAARGVIERAGHGERFTHRTGHGIGLSGHEPPSIHDRNETPLEVGMAFSIEPGIYLPGEFGVRLEEIVVVTPSGAERLSELPREVWVVEPR